MKLISARLILLFIFCVTACTENEEESLDQEYLESRQYEAFLDDASEEKKQNKELNKSLEWHLQQFSNCEISKLTIPFALNYEKVGELIMDASEGCIVESGSQRLKLLGESTKSNQKFVWVLLERETAYRDQEVLVATFQDDELRSFKTVGVFRKNPSEKISSEIHTRDEESEIRIISRTTRNIFYPFEQENIMTVEYEVGSSGDIRQL